MQLEVGAILEGKITGVKKFGAFVALPGGKTGMVHISEVSNSFIEDLSTVLSEGQEVKVKVLNIAEDGKIALSIKRTLPPEPRQNRGGAHGGQRGGQRGRSDAPRVWQPKAAAPQGEMSFEDMMAKFKSQSEEKISDLKRVTENRRGGGYSRRR
ncbi:MAG: S1 RNA-binding domain-containing protein [Oscillospiraceae bacterium]|nr:S1 RNA-binding domain-containing protein [Oscillospiraceae bacterium]